MVAWVPRYGQTATVYRELSRARLVLLHGELRCPKSWSPGVVRSGQYSGHTALVVLSGLSAVMSSERALDSLNFEKYWQAYGFKSFKRSCSDMRNIGKKENQLSSLASGTGSFG
eukprot:g1634.t1